jgi:AraC-like DNA-binding protein
MNSKRVIFLKLFFSYLVLLVVALLVIALVYTSSIQSLQKTLHRMSENSLSGVRDTVDTMMNNVGNYAVTILYDEDIVSFLSIRSVAPNSKTISEIYRYTQTLAKYKLADTLIKNIYVISNANGFVLFSSNAIRYTDLFHNSLFAFTGMNYQTMNTFLHDDMTANGYRIFTSESSQSGSELAYILKVPYPAYTGGAIIIHVNSASITNLLKQACVSEDSLALILNADGQLVSSYTRGQMPTDQMIDYCKAGDINSIRQNRYDVTLVESDRGWQYYTIIPRESALSDVYVVQKRIILTTICLVLVGILISYFLTRSKARSLGNMVTAISSAVDLEHPVRRNEYGMIEDAVTRLVNDRSSFKVLNENQRALIHSELLRRLLHEDYKDIDELRGLFIASGSHWTGLKYGIIGISVVEENGQDSVTELLNLYHQDLRALIEFDFYFFSIDVRHAGILFLMPLGMTGEQWMMLGNRIALSMHELAQTKSIKIALSSSSVYDRLSDVHQAYDETIVIAEYAKHLQHDPLLVRFNDLPDSDEFYHYPMDLELKLVQLVKTGNTAELEKLLQTIYIENFEKRVLSMAMIRQLVFELRGTIVRCLRTIAPYEQMNTTMQELSKETTIEGIFKYVVKISMEICALVNDSSRQEQIALKQRILDAIENRYGDSNFSIRQMADELHMAENTLYQFIHDHFAGTFWEMVENVRVHKACELLRDRAITISEVAGRVGYNSDHSFRRAFKRLMHVSPSDYMKANN